MADTIKRKIHLEEYKIEDDFGDVEDLFMEIQQMPFKKRTISYSDDGSIVCHIEIDTVVFPIHVRILKARYVDFPTVINGRHGATETLELPEDNGIGEITHVVIKKNILAWELNKQGGSLSVLKTFLKGLESVSRVMTIKVVAEDVSTIMNSLQQFKRVKCGFNNIENKESDMLEIFSNIGVKHFTIELSPKRRGELVFSKTKEKILGLLKKQNDIALHSLTVEAENRNGERKKFDLIDLTSYKEVSLNKDDMKNKSVKDAVMYDKLEKVLDEYERTRDPT